MTKKVIFTKNHYGCKNERRCADPLKKVAKIVTQSVIKIAVYLLHFSFNSFFVRTFSNFLTDSKSLIFCDFFVVPVHVPHEGNTQKEKNGYVVF
jgi:hypothetical protein